MCQTSLSLLSQLRRGTDDGGGKHDDAWRELVSLYQPLLLAWVGRLGVQPSDADDVVQEVLLAVSGSIESFEHNGRPGAFRAWLRATLVNRVRTFWRTRKRKAPAAGGDEIDRALVELEDPASAMSREWDRQHDRHVLGRLMRRIEKEFKPETWQAFYRVAIEGQSADAVAGELATTTNAVFIAKSRVLKRLRGEAAGLVDSAGEFF